MGVAGREEGLCLHCRVRTGPLVRAAGRDCSDSVYCVSASNAKQMPSGVLEAVSAVCVQHGGLTEDQAAQFVRTMETTKRLQLETWA